MKERHFIELGLPMFHGEVRGRWRFRKHIAKHSREVYKWKQFTALQPMGGLK